jgi:hypothetical protein
MGSHTHTQNHTGASALSHFVGQQHGINLLDVSLHSSSSNSNVHRDKMSACIESLLPKHTYQ